MIYLGKNEDRYDAVREALNDLNPVIRGTVVIKPDLPGPDTGPGGYTQISFLRAAIDWMRDRGNARRIIIAEGTLDGNTRETFRSLGYEELVTTLRETRGLELLDTNRDESYSYEFINMRGEAFELPVSATAVDADFLLTFSLLKTHDHVMMSGALRSLEGFLVGAESKLRVHGCEGKRPNEMDDGELSKSGRAYSENLLRLYNLIEPDACIIDGNGQEGNGPVHGTPKTTDLILAGDDALQMDVLSARLMGLEPQEVPYLQLADEQGLEPFADLDVRGLDPEEVRLEFARHKRFNQMKISA